MRKEAKIEAIAGFEIETCQRCGSLPTAHLSADDCVRTLKLKVELLEERVKFLKIRAAGPYGR